MLSANSVAKLQKIPDMPKFFCLCGRKKIYLYQILLFLNLIEVIEKQSGVVAVNLLAQR